MSLIQEMINFFDTKKMKEPINNYKLKTVDKKIDLNTEYIFHSIRLCKLARMSRAKKKHLTAEDIQKRIVRENVLMVSDGPDWFIDIETGNRYECGKMFGEEMLQLENELYVASISSLYHECYDIVQDQHIDPNAKLNAKQLRQIYNDEFARRNREF